MTKEIKCFRDFLVELAYLTNGLFRRLTRADKKAIFNYILEHSPFLPYLEKKESDFLSIYVMAFLFDYDFVVKYKPEKNIDFKIPFDKLSIELIENLNEVLLNIFDVMNADNIYNSNIVAFSYRLEQKFILNANEDLTDIFSELFIEMEKTIGGLYSIFGEAVAKNKNLECIKAATIVEYFIYSLIDADWEKEKFFAEILAHYKRKK